MYYIYLIVNKVNFKTYVGQRKSDKKWNEDSYMGSGKLLKLAQKKYGIENFEKFLIQYCSTKEEVNEAEKFWIKEYRSRGKAQYNISDGGEGGNFKGRKHSEETKRRMSEARKGKHLSEEWKKRISESHKGKHLSEEVIKKRAETLRGKHLSEEHKRKISEANKGHTAWNRGIACLEETKKKISEAMKGKKRKPHSEEWKKIRSEALKGKHWKLVDGKRTWY